MKESRKILQIGVLVFCCVLLLTGCETLRKKFTRKRAAQKQEVMIVSPRDYSAHPFPPDVLYKRYFTYWKSWNQEMITGFNDRASDKKVLDSTEQALINLKKMASFLQDDKAKELGVYIKKTQQIKDTILEVRGMPSALADDLRYKSERILSVVNRQFDLKSMKNHLRLE